METSTMMVGVSCGVAASLKRVSRLLARSIPNALPRRFLRGASFLWTSEDGYF